MPPGRIPGAKWSGLGSLVDGGTKGRESGEAPRPPEGEAHVSGIAQVGSHLPKSPEIPQDRHLGPRRDMGWGWLPKGTWGYQHSEKGGMEWCFAEDSGGRSQPHPNVIQKNPSQLAIIVQSESNSQNHIYIQNSRNICIGNNNHIEEQVSVENGELPPIARSRNRPVGEGAGSGQEKGQFFGLQCPPEKAYFDPICPDSLHPFHHPGLSPQIVTSGHCRIWSLQTHTLCFYFLTPPEIAFFPEHLFGEGHAQPDLSL